MSPLADLYTLVKDAVAIVSKRAPYIGVPPFRGSPMRAEFWFFITAMCMRNRTMGMPALEDGLFGSLLIFAYFWGTPPRNQHN